MTKPTSADGLSLWCQYRSSASDATRAAIQLSGGRCLAENESSLMGADPKLSEVLDYLKAEFSGFEIACLDDGEFETVLQLKLSDQLHTIRVQRDFLECTPAEDIREKLSEFRLAPTLRDLGNLPIAITVNGCIFT